VSPQQNAQDLQRDLRATLAARRELGPEYDDQFIQSLADRLTRQVTQAQMQAQAVQQRQHARTTFSAEERTAIAICSLIFGIPIIAISGGIAGPIGLICALVALVLINLANAQM
jgi:hypothetical protein